MPESAWKFFFYLSSWSYSTYLLFGTNYPFFHDPPSVFYGRGLTWIGQGRGGLCSKHEGYMEEPDTHQTSHHGCLPQQEQPKSLGGRKGGAWPY